MSSEGLFHLATKDSELSGVAQGIKNVAWTQVAASREVKGANFSNGMISFKFDLSGQQWWVPGRSYLRVRGKLDRSAALPATHAPNMDLVANLFQRIEFRIGGVPVCEISDYVAQVSALKTRISKSKAWLDSVGKDSRYFQAFATTAEEAAAGGADVNNRKKTYGDSQFFELAWVPPLAIFDVAHALPSGAYELVFYPQASASLLSRVFEVDVGTALDAAAEFSIEDMYFYPATLEGPRADDVAYKLDLEEIRCQRDVAGAGKTFAQKHFDVSPSTVALTVAFQDARAGTDPHHSASKFRSWKPTAAIDEYVELALNRLFINYANQSFPKPDADPSYAATADRTKQRYLESMMASGRYFDEGGCETISEYHARGSYYMFNIARDGTDGSTRVDIHSLLDITAADTASTMIMLFDHYKRKADIMVKNGRVVNVQVADQ